MKNRDRIYGLEIGIVKRVNIDEKGVEAV